mgnify:CR=1 FL=1
MLFRSRLRRKILDAIRISAWTDIAGKNRENPNDSVTVGQMVDAGRQVLRENPEESIPDNERRFREKTKTEYGFRLPPKLGGKLLAILSDEQDHGEVGKYLK